VTKDYDRELKQPFEAHEIEWRINRHGISNDKPWAVAIPYITSRAVQDRLDKVFGLAGWQNEIQMITAKGFISGISFKINDEWITKWDGAEGTTSNGMDLVKSGSSNALKRAAVLLGIGRYLYDLGEFFVECLLSDGWKHPYGNVYKDKKNNNVLVAWREPPLPPMALPGFDIDLYIQDMKRSETDDELEKAYLLARQAAKLHDNQDMIKTANAVGVEKRNEFKDKAALRVVEDTQLISEWLDKQSGAFHMVPNAASVTSLYNSVLKELTIRLKGTVVDGERLKQEFSDKYQLRIDELEPQENKDDNN